MPWDKYLKEGFESLERFQGEVIGANFKQGDQGIQLELNMRVDNIEAPSDSVIPEKYNLWFSIGKKGNWEITNNGGNLYNSDPDAGWVKTSKYGKLIQHMMDIHAPMCDGPYEPTDVQAWIGLNAIWEQSTVEYTGLNPTTITLPVQILNAGAPTPQPQVVGVTVTALSNGNATPPPPPPPSMAMVDLDAHWGANAKAWKDHISYLIKGKGKDEAKAILEGNDNVKTDSVLYGAIEDDSFFAWAERSDFMKEVDGVLV